MAKIPMTASAVSRKKKRRQSSGWRCNWNDELKLGENQSAWILITPGVYNWDGDETPYFGATLYNVAFQEEGKNYTSYRKIRGEDEGMCTLNERVQANDERVQRGYSQPGDPNRFFYNVIHFDLFRREPVLDRKTGNPKKYTRGERAGEIITSWQPVRSVRERKDLIADGGDDDLLFFRKKFISLSTNQQKAVAQALTEASYRCNCGGGLQPLAFTCNECEEVMLNVEEDDTDLSEEEVRAFGADNRRCRTCGHFGVPNAYYLCDSCDDPSPLQPEQVAIRIKKSNATGFASYVVTEIRSLHDFELVDKSPVIDADGNLIEDLQKLADNQFDFAQYTEPLGNAEWSRLLNLSPGQPGYAESSRSYGRFR